MMALIVTMLGTLSAVSSLKVFGQEKVMLNRERDSGVSVSAIFCAKASLDILENLTQPVMFLVVAYSFIQPQLHFSAFYSILFLTSFVASGVALIVSISVEEGSMTITAVLISLSIGIFMNGTIGLLYGDVKSAGLIPFWRLSYSRWAVEALIRGELDSTINHHYQELLAQDMMTYYGYFPVHQPEDAWKEDNPDKQEQKKQFDEYWDQVPSKNSAALFMLGLSFRFLCLFLLHYGTAMQRALDTICTKIRTKLVEALLHLTGAISKEMSIQMQRSPSMHSLFVYFNQNDADNETSKPEDDCDSDTDDDDDDDDEDG
ncbi:hypothetical protein CYMTET_53448 [Cymbomonas tetramitiformis]|uniref:ABC transporter family G domain-containing protein n=1 Tax=Cymbomonas tetramitiformis TaxID=36881 RepID=A0AAE0BGV5_9CHLO|nr:hypothetical protein CYMTET_53448 [Cymbomonas tetramitiformis]